MNRPKPSWKKAKQTLHDCRKPLLFLAGGAAALGTFWAARQNQVWMDWFIRWVSMPWKRAVSGLLDLIPYSVGELLCAGLVIALILAAMFTLRQRLDGKPVLLKRLLALAAAGLWAYVGMCAFWGVHYYGTSFQERAGLKVQPVSVAQLWYTADWFAQQVNETAHRVPRNEEGALSVDAEVIFDQFPQVYQGVEQEYPFLAQGPQRRPKKALFSRLMSSTGFTGYLFPYSGEATLNMDAPTVFLPVTLAHEASHQRGVAPEQEANFVGVAACISSNLPVYEYSGYLFGWLQVANALYRAAPRLYGMQLQKLSPLARIDLTENDAYWKKFQGPVRQVAEKTYTEFLYSYGQVLGMQSYGACVDLLVARYCPQDTADRAPGIPLPFWEKGQRKM